uniref:BZIP domain-containing protein n=1 Tax=Schistosoma mansoni TaxID=6183 RepID=A0A3Q0KPA7_SCHMA
MACDSLLGLEDAMDMFLQSADLFNDIDMGEFDIALKASELLENSDSDSGISVAGEKQSINQETNVRPSNTGADYVLTDAVDAKTHVSDILHASNKYCGNQVMSSSESVPVNIPSSNPTIPKFKRIIVNSVGERRLLHNSSLNVNSGVGHNLPISGVLQQSEHFGVPVKTMPSCITPLFESPNTSLGSSANSPTKSGMDCRSLDKLFPAVDGVNEIYEYCKNSTPSDPSLWQHSKSISSTSYPDSVFGSNSQFSPTSFLDVQDFSGPNESIITHTDLERIRKKQERMIKNRQAACLSRLRKKEYLERLEMKFEQLKRENLSLWRQNEEWRARCFRLERCIEDLQSRLPSSINSENLTVKSRSFEISSDEASNISSHTDKQITPREACSKTVSVHTLKPLNEVTVGYKSNVLLSRLPRLSDLGKSKTVSVQHLKNCQNVAPTQKTTYFTSVNSPRTFKWDSSSKRLLLTSKVDVESHSQSSSHQSQLKSITKTLISPQRIVRTVSHRSKVIATTSLLVMCGLFAMNIVPLSDLSSGLGFIPSRSMSYDGDSLATGKFAFGYPRVWSSVPHLPTGRRLLLNIPPTQEEDILTNDNLLQNASNNKFLFSGKFSTNHSTNNCGPNKNMSCSENSLLTDPGQIFQGWIKRHAVSTSNQSSIYRLLLTSSLHSLKAFEHRQRIVSSSKSLEQNISHTQKPAFLPMKHLNNSSPKSISPSRKESLEHFSARKISSFILNVTTESSPSNFPPPHRPAILRKYDLQPYIHPAVHAFEKLFNVVNRRNDTAYIVFLNRDHFLLPSVDPLPANMKQKITFLLPAHSVINGSSVDGEDNYYGSSNSILTMLQLDCEIMNATLLQSPVYNFHEKHTPNNH